MPGSITKNYFMAFFKTEKPKQFTYIPRFYDARKEQLEEQIKAVKSELGQSKDEPYVPNIRGKMRSRHEALYGRPDKPGRNSIFRRILTSAYFAVILLIVYYIIKILSVAQ